MANLSASALSELRVPAPSLDTQERLVADLDDRRAKIDTLIGKVQRFIEISKERRSALVTAAVTGQIDVEPAA